MVPRMNERIFTGLYRMKDLKYVFNLTIPQLKRQLCDAEEKLKETQNEANLWKKNYQDLHEAKQVKIDDFVKAEEIQGLNLEQAKETLQKLNEELKKQKLINNEQLKVNEQLKDQIDKFRQKDDKQNQEDKTQLQNLIDKLQNEQISLKDELLKTKKQVNEQLQQQIQKPQGGEEQIQSQTDPEKVLQLSSLQAECLNLKKQIQDVEQQRKDDLKNFEKLLGEGVNESQVIGLTSDKQQLQSDLRQLLNKCDQLQQEQITLYCSFTFYNYFLIYYHINLIDFYKFILHKS